ncbi:MFS general substrate transporter [Meredithblackwellia eburnea MCA 4105]
MFGNGDLTAFYEEALDKYGAEGAISPEAEKRLVRKLDWHVIPVLGICYMFYYVDKTTLSYAAIFGIKAKGTGLNLHGTQYSWLSSIFYFGWLAWAIPSNLILQRSPPATYLSINIFMWGVLLCAQAASKKFVDLAVLRILSGAFEAIADPCFMLITSMLYTREEQPMRISLWYSWNGVGVAAGGLFGYAIGHIQGALVSWRYEFIIVGAICSFWGIVILLLLPNHPATCMWLTREERLMAVARLRKNQTGIANTHFKRDQAWEFITDIKTYLFLLLGFVANIPNGGISNFLTFLKTVIQGLGYDTLHTALLGIPQGAFVVVWIMSGAFLNTRLPKNSRTIVCMIPTISGSLAFLLAPKNAYVGRLICFYLTGSYQCTFVLSLSLITSNTGGQTKKMLTTAIIWFGACIGNIAGPFFYKANQAPSYHLGIGSMLVCNCLEVLIIFALRVVLKRANAQKEKAAAALIKDGQSEAVPHVNETAFNDLTDKQNVK